MTRQLDCGCVEHPVPDEVAGELPPRAVVLEVDLDCPQHGPLARALLNRQDDPWEASE